MSDVHVVTTAEVIRMVGINPEELERLATLWATFDDNGMRVSGLARQMAAMGRAYLESLRLLKTTHSLCQSVTSSNYKVIIPVLKEHRQTVGEFLNLAEAGNHNPVS